MIRVRVGLLACICVSLLMGCSGKLPMSKLVGTYELTYRPDVSTVLGTETLVLKADGTYVQRFKPAHPGRAWENRSRWHVEDDDTVIICDRLGPVEWGKVMDPPTRVGGDYMVRVSGGEVKIEVEPDNPYEYVKVK